MNHPGPTKKKTRRSKRSRFSPANAGSQSIAFPRKAPLYRLIPDQFHTKLRWSGTYTLTASTFGSQNYGLSDFGTRIPKYSDQFFAIYKYSYIEAVQFTFEVVCLDVRPARLVLAESNTVDVTPTSFLELSETPRAKTVVVSQGGNHQVVKLNRTSRAMAVVGHRLEDDENFWLTQAAGPTAPVLPLMVFGYEPIIAGSVANLQLLVTATYSLKYFTLNHL